MCIPYIHAGTTGICRGLLTKDGSNPGAWAQEAGFVCNGAYTLDKWSHNESMVYVKNDNYYDAKNVTMKELHFMLSDDMTAVYLCIQQR